LTTPPIIDISKPTFKGGEFKNNNQRVRKGGDEERNPHLKRNFITREGGRL